MKIVINETGKTEEVSAKVASRLINKGKAHFVEEPVIPIKEPTKEIEVVTDIDLIEPIPERFTSFEELPEITKENVGKLKTSKPIWKPKKKSRKKKSKFKE